MRHTESLLSFPCEFPLKIIGWADKPLEDIVIPIVRKHVPNLTEAAIRISKSRAEKYMSITVKFQAVSQEQLDNLYKELSRQPEVLMTL